MTVGKADYEFTNGGFSRSIEGKRSKSTPSVIIYSNKNKNAAPSSMEVLQLNYPATTWLADPLGKCVPLQALRWSLRWQMEHSAGAAAI